MVTGILGGGTTQGTVQFSYSQVFEFPCFLENKRVFVIVETPCNSMFLI